MKYIRSDGTEVEVSEMNTHHLRAAAKKMHAGDHDPEVFGALRSELSTRDDAYYTENPDAERPVYPWDQKDDDA